MSPTADELDEAPSASPRPDALGALVALVPPKLVAALGLAAIAGLGLLGTLHLRRAPDLWWFSLDVERNIPAAFSALLLVTAGAAAALAGLARLDGSRWRWWTIGTFFAFMAVDEWYGLHEELEAGLGVDWQVLYAPLIVVAAAAWLLVLASLRAFGRTWLLFGLGGAAWAIAQTLEWIQWDGEDRPIAAYDRLMLAEELLEMTGSLAFGLALLVAMRAGPPGLRVRQPS